MYENVHPNRALVLLFVRTEVECRKGLLLYYFESIFPGASKVALTLDVTTKRRVIHVKSVSDVFAQEFSWSVS